MAINTLITIKDALTAFVAGHGQLKAIKFEADDHRAPVITESDSFPLLFVAPIDVQVGRAMNAHTLRIYVYERINDDRSDVLENANDTSLILRDIRVWWNDYGVDDIEIKEDPTGIFVSDRELDNLVGYYADIRFEIPSHGRCSVPVDITPIDPVTCADADYQITDTDDNILYSGTIPSGGSLDQTIADSTATLKDTADNVLSTTQILAEGSEDIVAPDATYTVEYLNGTPIQSGNILSGGFELIVVPNPVTCADATAELYFDGELIDTMQIPAGDTDAFNIDCSTTLNAVRVTSVSLSHAHTGTFVYVGDVNGKPSYEKSDDADRIIYYNGTRWILEKLGGGAHTHEAAIGNEAFPWLADWSLEDISMLQATIGTYCVNGGDALNILVNGTIEGDVNNAYPVEIELTDGVNPVTPDAVTIIGNTVTIEAPDATVENSDATYTDTVVSGGTLILPDETINIVDEDGNPLDTITFPVYTDPNIDITSYCPTVTPAPVGATLMKTGQTTSYRTGDDGDIEAGRATDFFTLASNNPFGSTARFTDELGGSTYTNNWVIDWSTYNGVNVLGYYRVPNASDVNWNAAIDAALGTFGTFSGCRLPNYIEMATIVNHEATQRLNYAPFNVSPSRVLWASTTQAANTGNAYALSMSTGNLVSNAKTSTFRYIPVRTFTVTGTTLT